MASYRSVVRSGEKLLQENNKSIQLSKLFMLELTRQANIDLFLNYEEEIDDHIVAKFNSGIERMLRDEPMQYILGYEWFYGRAFDVNKEVLIPRPETEELVANVLSRIDDMFERQDHIDLVDVGCGSGAIGISLKLEEPKLNVLASDISETAIEVAKHNAKKLGANIEFFIGSMLEPLISANKKVDVIVCNPPYIPRNEELEATVKEYEPNVALFGGDDGLYFYRLVFDRCREVLNDQGFMAFEIGYDQKEALLNEVQTRFPMAKSEVLEDINGKDRMLFVDFYHE